jgi:hypothetical protein
MDIQHFYRLIQENTIPLESEMPSIGNIVKEYPYFQSAIFLHLKFLFLYQNDRFEEELKKLSIFVNDRKALFYYIFNEDYDRYFRQTGKTEIQGDKTSALLDAFFESKGKDSFDKDMEYNIFNSSLAITDYFSFLQSSPSAKEDETSQTEGRVHLKHQDIIDTFINKSEMEGGIRIQLSEEDESSGGENRANETGSDEELNENVFFTETLAKIYIKQRKYEKAYKIIRHLSLNYPKKNIYFADQLSFLEKLIINSKYKDTK